MGRETLLLLLFFRIRQADRERWGEKLYFCCCVSGQDRQKWGEKLLLLLFFRTRLAGRDRDKERNSTFVVVFQDKTGKKKLVKAETRDSAAVYRWCFQRKR